jgi:hypothetical protein
MTTVCFWVKRAVKGLAGKGLCSQESRARCVPGSRYRAKTIGLAWTFPGVWDPGVSEGVRGISCLFSVVNNNNR